MKRALPFVALPLLLAACQTGHRVYHASVAPAEAHGVHYALPRKALTVELELERQREVRGECRDETALRVELGLEAPTPTPSRGRRSNQANQANQASQAVQNPTVAAAEASQTTSLTLQASLRERIEIDPNEIYLIDLRGRALESIDGAIELSPEGLLTSASVTATNHSVDVALAATGAVVDIASIALGATFAGDSRQSSCQRYANRIKELRSQRKSIFGGTWQGLVGGIPRDTLDRILVGLDRQERALLALFTTTERTLSGTVSCTVVPYPDPDRSVAPEYGGNVAMVFPLVHIDRQTGAVSPAHPNVSCVIPPRLQASANAQVQATQAAQSTSAAASQTTAYLTLDLRRDDLASQVRPDRGCTETREGRCASPQGLYYRVPREVKATVWWTPKSREILATRDILVPQLGTTLALPANKGRQSSQQAIALDPETGALRAFSNGSSSISSDQVQRLADDAVQLYGSAKGRDKELDRLQRERTILEEAVRIKEAQEQLGEGLVAPRPSDNAPGDRGSIEPNPDPPSRLDP